MHFLFALVVGKRHGYCFWAGLARLPLTKTTSTAAYLGKGQPNSSGLDGYDVRCCGCK